MIDMGVYFEPPKQSDRKMWSLVGALAGTGYRFHSEGSRYVLYGAKKLGGRIPSKRTVVLRIKNWLAAVGVPSRCS